MCSVREDSSTHCIIFIKYRQDGQSPSSFLAVRETTLPGAKRIADEAVNGSGHVCDGACKDWEAV